MGIVLKNIRKKFGNVVVLQDINLEIMTGELLALLGPSGSGKTTLLRIIAGLDYPDSGEVYIDGEPSHYKNIRDRRVGFVFQHYALFKHMTVLENIAFGLTIRPKHAGLRRIKFMLELTSCSPCYTWMALHIGIQPSYPEDSANVSLSLEH